MNELKAEGLDFKYECFDRIPRKDILKKYTESDIVIGQLFSQSLAKQGLEVLSSGTLFLTHLSRDNASSDEYYLENPAININKDTLKIILKELVPDLTKRKELALLGRPFIEKYHSPIKFAKELTALLDKGEISNKSLVTPTFYSTKFKQDNKFKYLYEQLD